MSSAPTPRPAPAVLLAREVDQTALRAAHRSGAVRRVRRGAYGPPAGAAARWQEAEAQALAFMAAATRQLRGRFAFSHESAALVHGLWVPRPEGPVHLTRQSTGSTPPPGLRRHTRSLAPEDVVEVGGIPVTSMERTVLDCAATLHPKWGLAVADSGIRVLAAMNRFDREESARRQEIVRGCLQAAVAHAGPARGVRRLRSILGAADGFSESPGETHIRWGGLAVGLPRGICQYPVECGDRTFYVDIAYVVRLASGELLILGEEYDGAEKYGDAPPDDPSLPLRQEKWREDQIREAGVLLRRRTQASLADTDALFRSMLARFPPEVRANLRPDPALAYTLPRRVSRFPSS